MLLNSNNNNLQWYNLLVRFIQIGLLITHVKSYHVSYQPDETIIKPCRSGTAHCMFGDCTKIWLRKNKHIDIIIECQCWPNYSGDWCNIYPPDHKSLKLILNTEITNKNKITPIINAKHALRTTSTTTTTLQDDDIWHEQNLQYVGNLIAQHRESMEDRLKKKFLVFHSSLTDNQENQSVNVQ
ncbi:unnamed protein product [Schistosoma turkestanicum]|nr:unnamed protein product [Schistosoma turkestanicum]